MPEVLITGAYVPVPNANRKGGQPSFARRGDVVDVPERVASRWVNLGVASRTDEPIEVATPDKSIGDMTIADLRAFAKVKGVAIPADTTAKDAIRDHIIKALQD
jgi:hypothetical protein